MIQIRDGVFETNSSSTHSITFASKATFDKWRNGELYLNRSWYTYCKDLEGKTWLTREECHRIVQAYNEHGKDENDKFDFDNMTEREQNYCLEDEFRIYTYDNFVYMYNYETYAEDYTTESGDEIVAFGYYGHD